MKQLELGEEELSEKYVLVVDVVDVVVNVAVVMVD